jgi:16S rRNA (uracil1498-N3)-methyltransferase
MRSSHEFALYYPTLGRHADVAAGMELVITDSDLVHRILRILRMDVGQGCLLFDERIHVSAVIEEVFGKKKIHMRIAQAESNQVLTPHITVLLPLLKRDECDAAIYALAELGVNDIQLLITEKVQRKWGGAKELERLERVVISAAEQSKQFVMPIVHEPQDLEKVIANLAPDACKLFFHPTGAPLYQTIQRVRNQAASHLVLLVGPEGDLSNTEQVLVGEFGFTVSALTPTVLRAQHAIFLGAGIFRSVLT